MGSSFEERWRGCPPDWVASPVDIAAVAGGDFHGFGWMAGGGVVETVIGLCVKLRLHKMIEGGVVETILDILYGMTVTGCARGGVVDTIGDIWSTACTSTSSYCLFFSYYIEKVSTLHPMAITEAG